MVVSEPTGLFIIPFSVSIGSGLFDILNETGVIFVPFVIALVMIVMDARAQGEDEGAPAIVAFKGVEKDVIAKVLVLFVFVMPWGNSPTYRYAQYSISDMPSFITGASNVDDLKPNSKFSSEFGQASPSLGWGVVHEWVTGFSNTAIGKIPCSIDSQKQVCLAHFSLFELSASLSQVRVDSEPLERMMGEFHTQCYVPVLNRIMDQEKAGEALRINNTDYPTSPNQKYAYNSQFMKAAYLGVLSEVSQDELFMETSHRWPSNDANKTLGCSVAMNIIDNELTKEVDKSQGLKDLANKYKGYLGLYSQFDGKPQANDYNAHNEIKLALYANGTAIKYNPASAEEGLLDSITRIAMPLVLQRTVFNDDKRTIAQSAENVVDNAFSTLHMTVSGIGVANSYLEQVQLTHFMPTLIILTQGAILMLGPLLVVLSGYDSGLLFRLILLYISTALTPMVFQIGLLISDLLYTASVALSAKHILYSPNDFIANQLNLIQHIKMIPIAMAGLMNILFQMAGGKMLRNYDAGVVGAMVGQVAGMYKAVEKAIRALEKNTEIDLDEDGHNERNIRNSTKVANEIIQEAKDEIASNNEKKHEQAEKMRRGYEAKKRYGLIKPRT